MKKGVILQMKRKLVSVLLMLTVLICMMPSAAFASQVDTGSDFEGTVYVSYSNDGIFSQGGSENGYMAYVPVDIAEVASDPSLAGDYPYDADGDGVNDVTLMMVFKYVLNEYGQGDGDLVLSGSAGSTYYNQGLWHLDDGTPWDENLNYYYNGMYPLEDEGWGATSDRITVHDGDFVDVMHYTSWSFWGDPQAGFQYFAGDEYIADFEAGNVESATLDGPPGYVVHSFEGTAGEPIEAALVRAFGDLASGAGTSYNAFENTVYYGYDLYSEEGEWETDSDGLFEMTFEEPGEYWIWTTGLEGESGDICNAPAVAKVKVTEKAEPQDNRPVIIAPAGSTITLGKGPGASYFVYNWVDAAKTETLADGRVQNTYEPVKDQNLFYRVQNPNGVTYWNYIGELKEGTKIEVTGDDIRLNDATFTKDTVYHSFEYNNLDLGDIYLNINERGYLPLATGATKELDCFRNWFAINSFTNDKVAVPDFHYEVMDINGNPSDLVTIVPDQHNSGLATLTAGNGTGLAVVRVTYDAMIYMQGYATDQFGGWGAGGEDSTRFSHIWPETSGIFVVTVGEPDGSGIDMGMTINTEPVGPGNLVHVKKVAGDNIDAEHDILYYLGEEGASYTFTPEEGTNVSIARSTVTDAGLTYNGFSTDGVTVGEDGTVTLSGLTDGRHIVKVEKNGAANYQILTARQVKLTLKDSQGNEQSLDHKWTPGESVTVILSEVDSPQEKFSGYYNNNFAIYYMDDNNKPLADPVANNVGRYDFSFQKHTVTTTIPADWEEDTFSLTQGAILMRGMSGELTGGHRSCSYLTGKGMTTGTAGQGLLGDLPDIELQVKQPTSVKVDFTSQLSGGFLHAPQFGYEVSSDLAESYGLTDAVDGVSALDVLVAAHELVYGEDFTPETAGEYLQVRANNVTMQFGVDGDDYYGGFFLNHGFPNDGTEASTGGYNGTTVGTQEVKDGDLVEFFFYEDDYYGDTYNWFTDADGEYSRTYTLCPGQDLDLVLDGFFAMQAYLCKDETELVNFSGAFDVDSAQIYEVDVETGALEEIEDAVTDEGDVTLTFDEPGTHYITAYGTEDCTFTQIMSLTKVVVREDHDLTKVEAKPATCVAAGNTEYWTCSLCGKCFSDENGENEIAISTTVIPVDPEAHQWNDGEVTTPASFEADGVKTYTCKLCGETKEEPITKYGFTVKVDGQEITDIEIVDGGYDASYLDYTSGGKVEDHIPLAIVTVPKDTETASITLNDHVGEYHTYYYTIEPDETGYTQFIDYGFGDMEDVNGMQAPVAHAGVAYDAVVSDEQVIRVQTKYDKNWVSLNLYAILFRYEADNEIVRLAGQDRYDTAIAAAEELKEVNGWDDFQKIIVASGADFPDALSASYLSYVKDAPILLVGKDDKSIAKVTSYINENLASDGTVYIVGGTGAVLESVEDAINGTEVRLAGSDRFATNLEVLKEAGVDGEELLIASGMNYADALSASAAARPIFLVGKTLTKDQQAYLEANKNSLAETTYVIGGPGAVADSIKAEVEAYTGEAKRLEGSDRFATSVAVANEFFPGKIHNMVIASGLAFPDGLSGGPVAIAYDAPLVLVGSNWVDHATNLFVTKNARTLIVMGGKGAVSKEIAETIAAPATETE